jgi:metal-responsive CopG/Arc/MetJ family transcriptional regulator
MHTIVTPSRKTRILERMKRIPNLRRIVVLLDAAMLKDIDEVRFRRRFLSRMEAIRALLRTAIDRELGRKPKKGE